jgi:hypothetical protein
VGGAHAHVHLDRVWLPPAVICAGDDEVDRQSADHRKVGEMFCDPKRQSADRRGMGRICREAAARELLPVWTVKDLVVR